jgi:superfamily II DNA/RNA helicase
LVFDKGSKLKQRNDLFDGTEVIVGTTKRICELYFQNGFNIAKLKLFIVLQMDVQISKGMKGFIARLAESLPKCRQLIFTQHPKEERFVDYIQQFVSPSATVEVKKDNSI